MDLSYLLYLLNIVLTFLHLFALFPTYSKIVTDQSVVHTCKQMSDVLSLYKIVGGYRRRTLIPHCGGVVSEILLIFYI